MYEKLWEVLALYEKTDARNFLSAAFPNYKRTRSPLYCMLLLLYWRLKNLRQSQSALTVDLALLSNMDTNAKNSVFPAKPVHALLLRLPIQSCQIFTFRHLSGRRWSQIPFKEMPLITPPDVSGCTIRQLLTCAIKYCWRCRDSRRQ